MSLIPYPWVRPFLFCMEPEQAHDHTLNLLATLQGSPAQWVWQETTVQDPVTVAGLSFANRVGMAAGLDKNARCIDALAAMGFGFVEVGTVTPKAQPGNPKPRMFRLPEHEALINRLGFNNEGLATFVHNVQKSKVRQSAVAAGVGVRLGLNIGKNASTPIEEAANDYLTCLDGVYPYADYVTINISSPNTQNLRSLQSDAALDALLETLERRREALSQQHGKTLPLFVKIAPDLTDEQMASVALTLRRYGVDGAGKPNQRWGVIATNTTLDRSAVQGHAHAAEAGGLSGRPVLEKSNHVIRGLRTALGKGFPIVGVGGVMSAADAVSKVEAGADLVQIYTGLIYQGPGLVKASAKAIADYARQHPANPSN